MSEQLILKRDQVLAEVLPPRTQIKILLLALIMIPIAFLVHLLTMFTASFAIPNTIIDIITFKEKTNQILRRKQDLQN